MFLVCKQFYYEANATEMDQIRVKTKEIWIF
jgi:hypothetical protein